MRDIFLKVFDPNNTFLFGATMVCIAVVIGLTYNAKKNTDAKLQFITLGYEECPNVARPHEYIWVKDCADYTERTSDEYDK